MIIIYLFVCCTCLSLSNQNSICLALINWLRYLYIFDYINNISKKRMIRKNIDIIEIKQFNALIFNSIRRPIIIIKIAKIK